LIPTDPRAVLANISKEDMGQQAQAEEEAAFIEDERR
jgi:hypothetical protein